MDRGLLLQYLIIALAVLVSAGVVAKKQFPGAVRRLRAAAALPLIRQTHVPRLQALGRRIAPPAGSGGASCCGGCDNCGPDGH